MNLRDCTAVVLAACVFLTSFLAAAADGDAGPKRQIDLLGPGAQVRVKLAGGKQLRGRLGAIDEDAFFLATAADTKQRRIAYDDVVRVQPVRKHYKAAGAPDAAEARRAVVGLGVGHHVMVRLDGDHVVRGHIGSIEPSQFTLLPDGGADALPIDYGSVHHIRKNPSTSTIVMIAVGAAVATVLIVIWAIREHNE